MTFLDQHQITENNLNAHTYLKHDLNANVNNSYTPLQLAHVYNFPAGNGEGVKIGIIELGGGYYPNDLEFYLNNLNITDRPTINDVSVDGATNNPNDGSGANLEVTLDLQIIAALAPKSIINMYFAPNTDSGFYNSILRAMNDGCKIISISWGIYESAYSTQNLNLFNQLFQQAAYQGVFVAVASGDNGSSDGSTLNNSLNIDFPSSSPYVTAVGGTTLNTNNNVRVSEVVWHYGSEGTGGGISKFFTKPDYQTGIPDLTTYRGIPDVAFNADPNTGYKIYYNSVMTVVGGTSCGAPLMSGLMARIMQNKIVPFINPILYNNKQIFYDILQGNNGAYAANDSYDCASGLGVPDCTLLSNLFSPKIALPAAAFTYQVNNLVVTLTNISTNATSYLWQYNNQTSSEQNPMITFPLGGSYVISLTATNAMGSNTVSQTIHVSIKILPISLYTYLVTNLTVKFTNASLNATSYLWQFGDGQTSTLTSPSHIFTAGTYNVSLTSYNTDGNSVKTLLILVGAVSNVNFTYTLIGQRYYKFNTINVGTYLWSFGDSHSSTLQTPTHQYARKGFYTVRLRIHKDNQYQYINKMITV